MQTLPSTVAHVGLDVLAVLMAVQEKAGQIEQEKNSDSRLGLEQPRRKGKNMKSTFYDEYDFTAFTLNSCDPTARRRVSMFDRPGRNY